MRVPWRLKLQARWRQYRTSGTALPCVLALYHLKPGDVLSNLHGCSTHKWWGESFLSICSTPSASSSPQKLSWMSGKGLVAFQLFRSGSPSLLWGFARDLHCVTFQEAEDLSMPGSCLLHSPLGNGEQTKEKEDAILEQKIKLIREYSIH